MREIFSILCVKKFFWMLRVIWIPLIFSLVYENVVILSLFGANEIVLIVQVIGILSIFWANGIVLTVEVIVIFLMVLGNKIALILAETVIVLIDVGIASVSVVEGNTI